MQSLQSVTRNLPSFVKKPLVSLISKKCYISIVENVDLADADCLRLVFSRGLGLAIVVGGSIVKLPQIHTIMHSRSVKGISLPAYILETTSYAIATTYSNRNHYPFSTYGESFFITLQNIAITFLIIHYSSQQQSKGETNVPRLIIAGFTAAIGAYVLYAIPPSSLQALQMATVPLSLFSKLPQISENFKSKSTGQLSTFAVASQILGCFARIFTTSTEVNDPVVLTGFIVALVLNVVLGAQIWLYWGRQSPSPSAEKPVDSSHPQTSAKVEPVATSSAVPTSRAGRRWARKVD